MKRRLCFSVLAVFLVLAGCKMQLVEDVESAPLSTPENATLDQVTKAIVKGVHWADWETTEVAPGHIVAGTTVRNKHRAVVDIFFDTKVVSIRYKDSENLNYNGRSIHKAYQDWVNDLKAAILRFAGNIEVSDGQEAQPGRSGDQAFRRG